MALNGLFCADVPLRTDSLSPAHQVGIDHWSRLPLSPTSTFDVSCHRHPPINTVLSQAKCISYLVSDTHLNH